MVSFGKKITRNSALSYYLLEVGITEITFFSNSFVTWSQILISCDQRHLWDPQNKQLTWVFMRQRDNSAPSTTLWWGITLKTQLPHLSATAKVICPWMLSLFSLLGPENLGRSLFPDPHQEKWADHHSTIRDKNPCEEMHKNTWTLTQLTWGGTGSVPACLSQLSRGHHLSLHPCLQQWGRWSHPGVKFLSAARIRASGWQLWDPGGYTVEAL